jgi:hypothetical protein
VLRLRCTCAYCKSEDSGERLIVDDEIPLDITVTDMHLVGNYGVGIHFSDGHKTGIYRFALLASKPEDDTALRCSKLRRIPPIFGRISCDPGLLTPRIPRAILPPWARCRGRKPVVGFGANR